MRKMWSGNLEIGLLNIAVDIYNCGNSKQTIRFKSLCPKCQGQIKAPYYCEPCKKFVDRSEALKGFQLPDKTFKVVDREIIDRLKAQEKKLEFISLYDVEELPIINIDKKYWILPQKDSKSVKLWSMLKEAMVLENKLIIAKWVNRNKEYLVAIRNYNDYLLMTTLFYDYELNIPNEKIPKPQLTAKEQKLFSEIMKKNMKSVKIEDFKDEYEEAVMQIIENPKSAKAIVKVKSEPKSLEDELESALKC